MKKYYIRYITLIVAFITLTGLYFVNINQSEANFYEVFNESSYNRDDLNIDISNIKNHTKNIKDAIGNFQQQKLAPSLKPQQSLEEPLINIAKSRKEALLRAIPNDPKVLIENAITKEERDALPASVHEYIEEATIFSGSVNVLHIDQNLDKNSGVAKYIYSIKDANLNDIGIFFVEKAPSVISGEEISVSGMKLDKYIVIASEKDVKLQKTIKTVVPNTIGERKTLVIPFNFINNTIEPHNIPYIENIMNETSEFLKENSYDQTKLVGIKDKSKSADVLNWITLKSPMENCSNWPNWSKEVDQIAKNAGYDPNNYDQIVYFFPVLNDVQCPGWGWAYIGLNRSWVISHLNRFVSAHEIGHNLGLFHSRSQACDICATNEYGDIYDNMGYGNGHFNTFQKENIGWLNFYKSPPIMSINKNGEYQVSLYETNDEKPKALKVLIEKNNFGEKYYYVEYRIEQYGNQNTRKVVVVHTGTSYDRNTSNLINLLNTPNATNFVLNQNETYIDNSSGIRITNIKEDKNSATIVIYSPKNPEEPKPILEYFKADKYSVSYLGSTELSWSTKNVSRCHGSTDVKTGNFLDWNKTLPSIGKFNTGILDKDITYTLLCDGTDGISVIVAQVSIKVNTPPELLPIIKSFTADNVIIKKNQSTILRWTTENVKYCYGFADVIAGDFKNWNKQLPANGTFDTGLLDKSIEYRLVCSGINDTSKTTEAKVKVTIASDDPNNKDLEIIYPNGGETFKVNEKYYIKWTGSSKAEVVFTLIDNKTGIVDKYSSPGKASKNKDKKWKINKKTPPGEYILTVKCLKNCGSGVKMEDQSDAPFQIIK